MSFKLYPDALHAFDMTNMARRDAGTPRGNYYRYDPVVTVDAVKSSFDFFDRNLSGQLRR